MRNRLRILQVTILAFSFFLLQEVSAKGQTAIETIKYFNNTLLTIMRNSEELDFVGRYRILRPALKNSFDMKFMAQFSAGRHWHELTETDQFKLIDAFERLWTSTYAIRFDGYKDEVFTIVDVVTAPRNTLLVKTNIIRSDGTTIAINYLMRETEKKWLVIDIFLKGRFSELAKQRSEYSSVLRRKGISELVKKVDTKIKKLEQEIK